MLLTAISALAISALAAAQKQLTPAAVYDGGHANATIELWIGNGGAGQSGLVEALANAFIKSVTSSGGAPFAVAWYKADTTYTIAELASGGLDVGITYSPEAEQIAIDAGIATSSVYAFRDHFLLVGPASNPAGLNANDTTVKLFSTIRSVADADLTDPSIPAARPPTRFLSRYDKSATNIKEALLFAGIGQVPWATSYSTWYHQYIAFPLQALKAAILLEEYTLTDRGTWLSLEAGLTSQAAIFKAGTDDASDPLLNPAHLLVGARAPNPDRARAFAEWIASDIGGQAVVRTFEKNGEVLYTEAPK